MSHGAYGVEYDGVVNTMQLYIEGCKQGRSGVMRRVSIQMPGSLATQAQTLPSVYRFSSTGSTRTVRLRTYARDLSASTSSKRLPPCAWKLMVGLVRWPGQKSVCRTRLYSAENARRMAHHSESVSLALVSTLNFCPPTHRLVSSARGLTMSEGRAHEHDAITRTLDCYIAGGRAGNGDLMRPAFHPDATMAGVARGSNTAAPSNICSTGST